MLHRWSGHLPKAEQADPPSKFAMGGFGGIIFTTCKARDGTLVYSVTRSYLRDKPFRFESSLIREVLKMGAEWSCEMQLPN